MTGIGNLKSWCHVARTPPRFVGAHRHTGMPIRFQPRNFLPRMRHEARRNSDKAMTELRQSYDTPYTNV